MSESGEPINKSLDDVVLPLYWAAKCLVDVIRNGDDDNGYAEMLSERVILLEKILAEVKRVGGTHSHFDHWHKTRFEDWCYYASQHGYTDKLHQLSQEAEDAVRLDDKEFDDAAVREFTNFIEKDN